MRTYRTQPRDRAPLIAMLTAAFQSSGATVLEEPNPAQAPFIYRVRKPSGEPLEIVCYAFRANKYGQLGRPEDEHRFQIKYGSDFQEYHDIWLPTNPEQVTLLLGVHLEERIFVGCDPAMYNPTWFSRSVEFKDEHVRSVKSSGWFGWERSRSMGRRKIDMPRVSCRTEALLGFTAPNLLRYVELEQLTTGLDPGERLLAADRLERGDVPHRLELELGLSRLEILDLINERMRLKVAVRGGAAELHLGRHLEACSTVEEYERLDKDGQPDFLVKLSGDGAIRVECKNVLRKTRKSGFPKVDFQKTRASRADPCSRYYRPQQFEVLAACLHPITESWEYRFRMVGDLAEHPRCPGHLDSSLAVGDSWCRSFDELVEASLI